MQVDKRIIAPFNTWWRTKNRCEPDLKAIEAFSAGFQAGMLHAIDVARQVSRDDPSAGQPQK